jgi:hypothetical protein
VALEEERFLQAGETLQALVRACRTYAESMGYAGGGQYYTKVWTEKPWRFAVHLAQDFALEEARGPLRPELAALVTSIGTLVEQCLEFWNRMGEGERGASLIDAQRCRSARPARSCCVLGRD